MISVDVDWTPLSRYLEGIHRKQLPYATAIAMTRLAQLAQDDVRSSLPRKFTLRSGYLQRGIRIVRAEKRDWPATQAVVYAKDWFMEPQETGEDRTPRGGRKNLSVPASGIRPTKETKVPRSKWPSALLKKGGKRRAFVGRIKGGLRQGQMAVMRRDTSDRYPLQVLYLFEPKTKGKKRLGMNATVTASVERNYPKAFFSALEKALKPRAVKTP